VVVLMVSSTRRDIRSGVAGLAVAGSTTESTDSSGFSMHSEAFTTFVFSTQEGFVVLEVDLVLAEVHMFHSSGDLAHDNGRLDDLFVDRTDFLDNDRFDSFLVDNGLDFFDDSSVDGLFDDRSFLVDLVFNRSSFETGGVRTLESSESLIGFLCGDSNFGPIFGRENSFSN